MNIIYLWLGSIVFIVLPFIVLLLWKKKTNAAIAPFFVGCLQFFLWAMVLEQISHYIFLVLPWPGQNFIAGNAIATAVYACLAAGIFEETGRLVGFKFLLKKHHKRVDSVTYGIGHGGMEVILLAGLSFISSLIVYYMGGTAGVSSEELLASLQASSFLIPLWERASAMCVHVGFSILVFAAVWDKRYKLLFPLAIILHAIVDSSAMIYRMGAMSILTVEIVVSILALIVLAFAIFIYKKLPVDAVEETATAADATATAAEATAAEEAAVEEKSE